MMVCISDVLALLSKIAPSMARIMNDAVDTVHRIGRKEENKTRQVIIQFTKREHRNETWRLTKESSICKDAAVHFSGDLTMDDMVHRQEKNYVGDSA